MLSKLEPGGGTGILANHSSREAIAAIWITRHKDDFYDEEPDNGFLESLRHKSFKRAILPKVDEEKRWTDSMRDLRVAKDVGAVIIGCQPPGSEGQVWRGRVRLCTVHEDGSMTKSSCQRQQEQREEEKGSGLDLRHLNS